MKRPALIVTLSMAGFIGGYAVGPMLMDRSSVVSPAESGPHHQTHPLSAGRDKEAVGDLSKPATAKTSTLRSADTLETIKEVEEESLYSRLALWLLDASEQDIAAYWDHYRQQKIRSFEINDLIFIHWTRHNPQAAIAATAGTPEEKHAWRAWACHDPKASLAAAIASGGDRVNDVAWGVGQFQGEWLRDHFDEIPESARENALRGLTQWDNIDKPEEILDLLKREKNGFDRKVFANLARKDPWAALDWMQENPSTIARNFNSFESAVDFLVETMGQTHPDALPRLASQFPPGAARRHVEAKIFSNLLNSDPAAALAEAEATTAPRIAAERLAAVGLSLATSDPDKALDLAHKIFSIYPYALTGRTWVNTPESTSSSGSPPKGVEELMEKLMASNPAQVLETVASTPEGLMPEESAFSNLCKKWADKDIQAFTEWVNQQSKAEIRNPAVSVMIYQLIQRQQFPEAVEWAMSSEKGSQEMFGLMGHWAKSRPEEASAWVEAADISPAQKERYKKIIQTYHNPESR